MIGPESIFSLSVPQVADYYTSDQLQFRMHLHNLPYHRNSHVISKATHVLDKYAPNKNTSFKWIDLVYR